MWLKFIFLRIIYQNDYVIYNIKICKNAKSFHDLLYTHKHTYRYTRIYKQIRTYIHTNTTVVLPIHTYTYKYAYAYTNTHTHTHTHVHRAFGVMRMSVCIRSREEGMRSGAACGRGRGHAWVRACGRRQSGGHG